MKTLRKIIHEEIEYSNIPFKLVAGAVDLDTVLKGTVITPGCYIITSTNDPGANEASGDSVVQQVRKTISILVITNNVAGRNGVANADQNEELCEQLRELLVGFKADGEKYTPLEYKPSSLITIENGVMVWEEVYETTFFISN